MTEPMTSQWATDKKAKPGSFALTFGVILFVIAFVPLAWNRHLIEGPPDEQLVPVQARLLSADCAIQLGSSQGAAHASEYGEPLLRYEYQHEGQKYESTRFVRQARMPLGSMTECRRLVTGLRSQPFVQAWVDPARPEFAILSKRVRSDFLSWIAMGVGAASALVGLYRLLRRRRA